MATRAMRPTHHKASPFTIYADSTSTMEHERSNTMSEAYDADASISSTSEDDMIMPSIEPTKHEVRDFSTTSSIPYTTDTRKHSAAYTTISSIPPSLPYNSDIKPYTPKRGPRAAFRSPSSVRALQMGSPPPFSGPRSGGSPRRYDRYESGMSPPSSARRCRPETPSSLRSGSVLRQYEHATSSQRSHGSERGASSARDQTTPQRTGPLVLLHITLLPCSSPPYSAQSMAEIAPGYITENWRLLQEKLTDTVLERGLLISHPDDEFDLLEERVLETLDLCPPRITACGHYYGGESDSDSGNDSGVSDLSRGSREMRAICNTPHEDSEKDVCLECDQQMHLPGKGVGTGNRKWNVKIFAANGLMKASAWAAVFADMERVDVEIEPWMPEDVKRALDARLEQEEEEERRQADQVEHLKFELREMETLQAEAESARLLAEERAKEMEMLQAEAEAARRRAEEFAKEMDEELKRASAAQMQALTAHPLDLPTQTSTTPLPLGTASKASDVRSNDIPLSTLLYNYLYLLAQDRRNLALGFLSILVLFLSHNVVAQEITRRTTSPLPTYHESYTSSAAISISSSSSLTTSSAVALLSLSSPATTLQASAPESQSTAPVQQSSASTESNSPSTSVYSPPAATDSHIPRSIQDTEKEADSETSLKAPHSVSVSAGQASPTLASTASTSPTTREQSKQPLCPVRQHSLTALHRGTNH
jgi:hypothetical protein